MEEKLVTIATYNYSRAEITKEHLEASGITCYLRNVNLIQPNVSSGVQIRINEKDVEKALKIMFKIKQKYDDNLQKKQLTTIKKILVPIDFSDYSYNACLYALELAKKVKAQVKIFYSINTSEYNPMPMAGIYLTEPIIDPDFKEVEIQTEKKLKDLVSDLKSKLSKTNINDVKIDYTIGQGFAEDEIIDFSEEYNPGLIIMGTKGKSNKSEDIIGSITSEIIEYTKIPVLAVPIKSSFNSSNISQNIMYATDFDDADFQAIYKLFSIVTPLNPNIYCVHVGKEEKKSWCKVQMQGLKEYFNKLYKSINLECDIIEDEEFFDAFDNYTIDKKINIVAIITHKRDIITKLFNLNPSRTKKLLYHTNIPLLVFHA